MKIKRFVATALIIFFSFTVITLIGGLIVPKSVLLKFSKVKSSDLTALTSGTGDEVEQAALANSDNATTQNASTESNTVTSANTESSNTSSSATGTTSSASSGAATGGTASGGSTSGGGGSTPAQVAPNLTFAGSPTTITLGATSVLSWSIAAGATSPVTCNASGGWSGSQSTSGSTNKTPTSTTTYTLTCSNVAGQSVKSVTITVNPPVSTCGSGGSCTAAEVAQHSSQSDCWMIVTYTASGGNGTGKVYKIASGFFGSSGTHNGLAGAPSLSASTWCGKNISSTFNGKHSGGSRSDGSNTAIWWLTNNGNSLIGNWSGN